MNLTATTDCIKSRSYNISELVTISKRTGMAEKVYARAWTRDKTIHARVSKNTRLTEASHVG